MQISLIKGLKISILLLTLTAFLTFANAQQVIVSDDAAYTTPASGAMLDVKSANKGFLPPRIALTGTSDVTTIPSRTAGLLVYNTATAGNVTPGYYYWNGFAWERILNSANDNIQTGIVTKSATATLSKTENFVYATGDITLTLPEVTSADNGLTIFIKNTGTYMDHTLILPSGSAKIDDHLEHHLTRFESNTFIAKDGNWSMKVQTNRHVFNVGEDASFQTIAEAVEFLGAHMHEASIIQLSPGIHDVTSNISINLPYPLTIQAPSYGMTEVDIADGITGFTIYSTYFLKFIDFVGQGASPSGVGVNIATTDETNFFEIKDSYFSNFDKGITITGKGDLWLFETDFEDCDVAGVDITAGSGNITRFRSSECDYINCAKGINLASSAANSIVSISNTNFYNSANQVGISYTGGSFLFNSIIISNNSFNNVGEFASGFNFTLARDANIFLENNAGVPTERPHAGIKVDSNTAATTISTAGVFTKANFTTVASNAHSKFAISGNRLTYLPVGKTDLVMNISGDLEGAGNNMVITVTIVKNGVTSTLYGETRVRAQTGGQPYNFSSVVLIPLVTTNDYFEIFITSNGGNVTITDLNWFAQSL